MKICRSRFRNNWLNQMRRFRLYIFLMAALLLTINYSVDIFTKTTQTFEHCQSIDVVYTWVNGSDPEFIKAAQKYDMNYDVARYDDKNELRYSLRSLEKYAPWVRHVYIVTNGQIPHWLDLSYDKVTVIPHELLATDTNILPTFSSAAIETFLHRIPQLSERFLYLNDDIFLNAPLYLEDLYTESEGVRIYQAWMVPDCAPDCPWTYIADGACDAHCNIAACQYDGEDCANVDVITTATSLPLMPQKKSKALRTFRDILHAKNMTALRDFKRLTANYNRAQLFPTSYNNSTTQRNLAAHQSMTNSTKDIYSQSLIYTNMLLNRHYGFKARSVLAHVGFLLERHIIEAMHEKFKYEVKLTTQHRFRAADDLQFAFAYYTFIMSENRQASLAEIFDEFDTDKSDSWSDREVRTFLARMYPLPLDWAAMHYFENVVNNCTQNMQMSQSVHPTLVYERYEDSNLPTISKQLVEKCAVLAEALTANFGARKLYKHKLNPRRNSHSNFMMLTSNITEVVDSLDKFRMNPSKFNCINDNLNPLQREDNELIRQLLEDFYLSFFPQYSKFELPPQYRNRFTNWWDYLRWRRRKRAFLTVAYTCTFFLVVFLCRCLCMHKAKIVRRCVQKL